MSQIEFPEVPESLFEYFMDNYPDLSYNDALDQFLEAYRLDLEEKEEMDEKEIEQLAALREEIRKQAYKELEVYYADIKYVRNEIKKFRDSDSVSKEFKEELNELLRENKFNIHELGNLPAGVIRQIFLDLEDEMVNISEGFEGELDQRDYEDEEYRQEQEDYRQIIQEHAPIPVQDIQEDLQELKEEFQPYEFQPEQLPGFDLERQTWPSDGIRERPVVNEEAERENEFYQSQILRLQQLILADPENENNKHYYNLLSQMRQKIKENQGIIHDHVNYHIGPEDMGIEIFPYEQNDPLLNPGAAYQNVINRRAFDLTRDNLRQDPEIQARMNRIFMEGKYQFAPQKGFMPYVSRQLWESMTEGNEVGWSKAYEGNILGYNRGLFGNLFSKRTESIEDEVHKEMEEQIEPKLNDYSLLETY